MRVVWRVAEEHRPEVVPIPRHPAAELVVVVPVARAATPRLVVTRMPGERVRFPAVEVWSTTIVEIPERAIPSPAVTR